MGDIHGGDLFARQLARTGINTVFGVLAGPMVPVFEGCAKAGITVVSARHEQQAAFMAQAWALREGVPGVVIVGSGPGMTNALTSMHVANRNGWPLVVLGGSAPSIERQTGAFQEADQVALARPASRWVAQVDSVRRVPELTWMALAQAVSGRPGAVYLDVPAEVPMAVLPAADAEALLIATPLPHGRTQADSADIATLTTRLRSAKRPLIIIGDGAAWSRAEEPMTQLIERGLPFLTSPMGRGLVPDNHELSARAARSMALADADVIVSIGSRFDWMLPAYDRFRLGGAARPWIAQVDAAPDGVLGGTTVDLPIVADPSAATRQLVASLGDFRRGATQWTKALRKRTVANRARTAELIASTSSSALNQLVLFDTLDRLVPPNVIVAADGEATLAANRRFLAATEPRSRLDPGPTGCMGVGVPYAIGAALSSHGRPVLATLGDYAFGASGMELETAARLGLKITFVVANNQGIVGHSLQSILFDPLGQPVGSLLPARYELMAEMVGGYAARVDEPGQLEPALKAALDHDGVSLVNVALDPRDHGIFSSDKYLTESYGTRPKLS